jgi:hypothetical protein
MTLRDGIVLVAVFALGMWVSQAQLMPWLYVFSSIKSETRATNSLSLSWHWGSLIARRAQPVLAILTLGTLVMRFFKPRPDLRRLVRQPGFTATLGAALAIVIGGAFSYATTKAKPSSGAEVLVYVSVMLLPRGCEPGIAVATSWLLLVLGRRWHLERSWIDRLGMVLGVYWLLMIGVAGLAPQT